MAKALFDPNRLSFEDGVERIQRAVEESGLRAEGRVLTSRDPDVAKAAESLAVENVPEGFTKWQLPVYLREPSQLFLTVAEPGVEAPPHSHDEGDGIRFIAGGSIDYEGKELIAGDWMYIPAGSSYSFRAGRFGAIMCYCYCCCCA
jgi:quercetin dioxygenase-like cupin family protein